MKTRKSLLCFALASGVLGLSLTGCGESGYENYEECQLKEVQKLSRDSKELSEQALNVIASFCEKYPTRNEKNEKNAVTKEIANPIWEKINTEKGKSKGDQYLIDVNNIDTIGVEKIFWILKLKKDQKLKDKTFLIERLSANCAAGNLSRISSSQYDEGKPKENFVNSAPTTIVPGSLGADIYRYVCKKK